MSLYEHYVLEPFHEGLESTDAGIPIPMPKLSKYTNYIEKGQNVMIGGKQTSGKTSYMDYMYFVNVFLWWEAWENGDKESRPPIKLFYFNMRSNIKLKMQKWACIYLKLKYKITIDIPTLNNGIGKLYEVDENKRKAVEAAIGFFKALEEVLVLTNGRKTASDIYNTVKREMLTTGKMDESGVYTPSKRTSNQINIICIDNVDRIIPESDGTSASSSDGTKRRMCDYIDRFKNTFNMTTICVVPSVMNNPRNFKDSEPSYKELGQYSSIADIGLVTYNPYNEGNMKFLGYNVDEFIFKNKNRLRTVSIVRNSKGVENITVASVFVGECGYFRELPRAEEGAQLDKFKELLAGLD